MDSSKPRKLPYQMADYQSRCCFLYMQYILAPANICKYLHSYSRVLLKALKFWNDKVFPLFDE